MGERESKGSSKETDLAMSRHITTLYKKHGYSVQAMLYLLLWCAVYLAVPERAISQPDAEVLPYEEVAKEYGLRGFKPTEGIEVIVQGENFVAQGGGAAQVRSGVGDEPVKSVNWGSVEGHWLEWAFEVPASGLYNMAVRYYPGEVAHEHVPLNIYRSMAVDGKLPFAEMRSVKFIRFWEKDRKEEAFRKQEAERDRRLEIDFRMIEQKFIWRETTLDYFDTAQPYLFYLEKGRHSLRLTALSENVYSRTTMGFFRGVKEAMDVDYIKIFSPRPVPAYEEVLREYRANGIEETKDVVIKIEAEDYAIQGDYGLPVVGGDARTRNAVVFIRRGAEPSLGYYNSLGAWWEPGLWLEWKFNALEDGLYKALFKYSLGTGVISSPIVNPVPISGRNLKIDGSYPFKEMESIKFELTGGRYDYTLLDDSQRVVRGNRNVPKWRLKTLAAPSGEPYLFHLTKGQHTLHMQALEGMALVEGREKLHRVADDLTDFINQVRLIVARSPKGAKLDIAKELPDTPSKMRSLAALLDETSSMLTDYNRGQEPAAVAQIKMIREHLARLAANPNGILKPELLDATSPYNFRETVIGRLRIIVPTIADGMVQPLDVDWIAFVSPDAEVRSGREPRFYSLRRGWSDFVNSFRDKNGNLRFPI
jgi:hypothetical protein